MKTQVLAYTALFMYGLLLVGVLFLLMGRPMLVPFLTFGIPAGASAVIAGLLLHQPYTSCLRKRRQPCLYGLTFIGVLLAHLIFMFEMGLWKSGITVSSSAGFWHEFRQGAVIAGLPTLLFGGIPNLLFGMAFTEAVITKYWGTPRCA